MHTSGMERAQLIRSCNVDHSVCLLFIISTLTELAIEGNRFGINTVVRVFTNCLRHNIALKVFTHDPVPVSVNSDVNTGVLDALPERMLN